MTTAPDPSAAGLDPACADRDALVAFARARLAAGDPAGADPALAALATRFRDQPAVFHALADGHLHAGRIAAALDAVRDGLMAFPAELGLRKRWVVAVAAAGHRDEAIAACQAILAGAPGDVDALASLAALLEGR